MTTFMSCLVFLLCAISNAKGNTVTFEASPSELLENLTHSAAMRCELSHNASDTDNIRHVTSIFVLNNEGDDVASVTAYDAPAALADPGNLQVKGSVSAVAGEGYLELSWADPSQMTIGQYTCTIDAIDTNGHTVVLTSHLEMTSRTPAMMDLINDINSQLQTQKQENQKQEQEINKQEQDIQKQNQDLQTQQRLNVKQEQYIQQQQTTILQLQQDIQDLQKTVNTCSSKVAFMASMTPSVFVSNSFTQQTGQTVVYGTTSLNIGGNYNNNTGVFKCVVPGLYSFQAHGMHDTANYMALNMKHNSETVATMHVETGYSWEADSVSAVLKLEIGDEVKLVVAQTSTFNYHPTVPKANIFSGHLLNAEGCHP